MMIDKAAWARNIRLALYIGAALVLLIWATGCATTETKPWYEHAGWQKKLAEPCLSLYRGVCECNGAGRRSLELHNATTHWKLFEACNPHKRWPFPKHYVPVLAP